MADFAKGGGVQEIPTLRKPRRVGHAANKNQIHGMSAKMLPASKMDNGMKNDNVNK